MSPVTVDLFPARLSAAAGSDVDTFVAVTNTDQDPTVVHLVIVGDAAGWASMVPEVVTLRGGDRTEATLRFRLPRSAPGGAGTIPFSVRAVPQEAGAYEAVAEGTIEISGRSELAVRLTPIAVRGAFGGTVKVAVDNLGVAPARAVLTVDASPDVEATIEPDSVVVEPGGTEFARLHLRPHNRQLIGGSADHSFRVIVDPLGGAALSADGRFEQRPVLVALVPKIAAVAAAVAILAVGLALLPRGTKQPRDHTSVVDTKTTPSTVAAEQNATTTIAGVTTTAVLAEGQTTTPPTAPPGPRRILFESKRDGNQEIYVANPDGSAPTNLTNSPSKESEPTWSPDGTKIAFDSDRTGNFEVFVMNADGTGVEQLTHEPAPDGYPSWSPDGSQIAFVSFRDSNSEIYVMKSDGTTPRRLTKNLNDDARPAWSPDGRQIAFHTDRDGNYEIYTMNVDGTSPTNITQNPASDQNGAWSPDGVQLAFDSTRSGDREVYVVSTASMGGTPVDVTNNPASDLFAAWSPDGSRLVFQSDRDADPELYLIELRTKRVTRLTMSPDLDGEPDWL